MYILHTCTCMHAFISGQACNCMYSGEVDIYNMLHTHVAKHETVPGVDLVHSGSPG